MTSRDRRVLCGMSRHDSKHVVSTRRWSIFAEPTPDPILQVAPRFQRDQYPRPSCAGQAVSGAFDQIFPELPRQSAVSIWREARRRMGLALDDLDQGTQWWSVFAGLDKRGFDDWRKGEDADPVEGGKGAPPAGDDLPDELQATDRRGLLTYHALETLDEVDDALRSGAGVVASFGCRDLFFDLAVNEVATTRHLGGDHNGHAMRLFGRISVSGARRYIIANSWGAGWGGCTVAGLALPGSFVADEDAVRNAWNIWAMTRR